MSRRPGNLGVKKIIADPVLSPVGHGAVNAICRYRKFREWYPDMPVFFGAGNVTELMDADSIGAECAACRHRHGGGRQRAVHHRGQPEDD